MIAVLLAPLVLAATPDDDGAVRVGGDELAGWITSH
jgi:hypothetical protein